MASPTEFFLDKLTRWEFDLPLPHQWIIVIYDFPQIVSNTIRSLEAFSSTDWDIQLTYDQLTQSNLQLTPDIGCFFAQNVTIPGETFAPRAAPLENSGGFLPGVLAGERTDTVSRSLQIDFRETNLDFSDLVIRPWIIAASHFGLIAQDNPAENVRADRIQCIQYTRGRRGTRPIRKIYNLYGCVPYALEARQLSYGDYDFSSMVQSTQWVYDNITVETSFVG